MDLLEAGLRQALFRDGARMIESLLNDPLYQGSAPQVLPGEKCYHGREKTVETLFGEVHLLRDYIVSRDGVGRVPLDQSLGLIEGYSPGLAKMMARMAAQESFESGSKDLLFYAVRHRDGAAVPSYKNHRVVDDKAGVIIRRMGDGRSFQRTLAIDREMIRATKTRHA